VGFRPFIWRTAQAQGLSGFVLNTGEGVTIELQGSSSQLDAFQQHLQQDLPPLAQIDSMQQSQLDPLPDEDDFEIRSSSGSTTQARLPADSATCPACLAELFDPSNRRYRYAFINCTDCGPRYTVTHRLPYDRANTSMLPFLLCPSCRSEYQSPHSRRFHAEPTACPTCGPQMQLTDRFGISLNGDPLHGAWQILRMGRSIAMKGLGGFHLVCDATNPSRSPPAPAQASPRQAAGGDGAECGIGTRLLRSQRRGSCLAATPERPIVLLQKKPQADQLMPDIAPGIAAIGVMLPYTPLQWLLFHEALGQPQHAEWREQACDRIWVMTSANLSGEPIVTSNQEARERLNKVADVFLLHNRNIVTRCDDSVLAVQDGQPLFYRRACGFVPDPLPLSDSGPDVLALGAYLKTTVTVLRDQQAFVSQHVGDLDHPLSCESLEQTAQHLLDLTGVTPQAIACDLQPDSFSSQLAQQWSQQLGIPLLPVQHHHAHLAAVMAEQGLHGPLLGLALDGFGLGKNGGAWGGELMMLEGASCERMGHITPLPLPGGDKAAQEPWRMAVGLWHRLASDLPCLPTCKIIPASPCCCASWKPAQLPGHHQHGTLVRRHCRPGWHLPGAKLRK
jgi:hydrogenase maturation protein HypF